MARSRILVIKLGALGDFLMALGPMQAIRRHHPDAELVLLTRQAYRDLGRATGLFAEIWVDPAPRWNPLAWLRWRAKLRSGGFVRVYDLQTSDRSRSEEHTSELQSLMRISYAVFCLKKKKHHKTN